MGSILLVAPVCVADCGSRVVDAVDLTAPPDGATGPVLGQAQDAGADSIAVGLVGPGPKTDVVWPNPNSSANSQPWLMTHHDEITAMRPTVLVLDFYNRDRVDQARAKVQERIDAIATGSRYHGYSDSNAPPFLVYSPRFVDLTDHPPPPNWPYVSSTALPTDNGTFDVGALFSQSFASYYNYPDPTEPSGYLTLCELFERGIINELWLVVGDSARVVNGDLLFESKQAYDAENRPKPGQFSSTGYASLPASMPHCTVTARIAVLDPTRVPACDLVPRSVNFERMRFAIQYLQDNASDFFNDNFKAHYPIDFNSWSELVAKGGFPWCTSRGPACISYPTETEATGIYPDSGTWKIDPFVQGCGSANYPPNAQFRWDYSNSTPVQSRCENYGLQNGTAGSDRVDVYTNAKEAASALQSGDDPSCAGGWQIYLAQSMPGLNNGAYANGGTRMKNWWPFLFY
jgi:hypothetical protein